MQKIRLHFLCALLITTTFIQCHTTNDQRDQSPNILLILVDDMGFSDLGFMGSLIETPHINELAANGLVYNQFYNTGRCCPSRAALLTGLYPHQTGMGWMTSANLEQPGYTGILNRKCITIAQALQKKDYACYMTGKWHLTNYKNLSPEGPKHNWPLQRGFDRFFGHLGGAGSYFNPSKLLVNNEHIQTPQPFYLTTAVTDTTIQYIKDHFKTSAQQPFFTYVSYLAPHRPLHALPEDITKYKGKYAIGWDKLRKQRLKNLKKGGFINQQCTLSPRPDNIPAWNSLSKDEQEAWAALMAIYAAQIDRIDQGVGQIIATLKAQNALDNTLIFFLSDNGASAEAEGNPIKPSEIEHLGQEFPRHSYREAWANVSNTPFGRYKHTVYEGGIATPLIVHWPAQIKDKGSISSQVGHMIDIFPSILEATQTNYPKRFKKKRLHDLAGKSLLPNFSGEKFPRGPIFFEHEAYRAVRKGQWKLVAPAILKPPYIQEWELYNVWKDRSETKNLADQHPQKVKQLAKLWDNWAKNHQVYPLDGRDWFERLKQEK